MRKTVGSIVKGLNGKPDYIKMSNDVNLKRGEFLNLESKATQIASIQEGITAGRIAQEKGDAMLERANKIPDFVRFEIVYNPKTPTQE